MWSCIFQVLHLQSPLQTSGARGPQNATSNRSCIVRTFRELRLIAIMQLNALIICFSLEYLQFAMI